MERSDATDSADTAIVDASGAHQAIARALIDLGAAVWVPGYLLRRLPAHARLGGVVSELVEHGWLVDRLDAEFLIPELTAVAFACDGRDPRVEAILRVHEQFRRAGVADRPSTRQLGWLKTHSVDEDSWERPADQIGPWAAALLLRPTPFN